jgi:DNA polymerase III alpha subunit
VKHGRSKMRFEIAICVDSVRDIITTKGRPMAFVTAHDDTYQMDNIVVFSDTFEKYEGVLEDGNVLKIRGQMDDRGSLICQYIERMK